MLITIISFILVLSVLVLVHELGHFFVAKRLGVKVEEFGFGFPPRVIGKKIGETVYSINLLPIGGFVKLYGEDDAGGGKISYNKKLPTKDIKRTFYARPAWQRATIIVAGVVMNFLLAVVINSYLFSAVGIQIPGNQVVIADIAKNSPAEHAGLKTDDTIISINGEKITAPSQVIDITKKHLGEPLILQIRNTKYEIRNTIVTPRKIVPKGEGAMGIAVRPNFITRKYPWYQAPFIGTKESFVQSWIIISGIWDTIVKLIISHSVPSEVAGPVGIAQITGQFVRIGFDAVLSLVAMLSLNLAILNVLPIPALDGGRLFFILVEIVTRKKIHPKFEAYAHTVGMVLLLTLIVLITFHDITNLLTGKKLIP